MEQQLEMAFRDCFSYHSVAAVSLISRRKEFCLVWLHVWVGTYIHSNSICDWHKVRAVEGHDALTGLLRAQGLG